MKTWICYFANTEMNNKWKVDILQNNPLSNEHAYSREFSIGWNTSEIPLLFLCKTAVESIDLIHPPLAGCDIRSILK